MTMGTRGKHSLVAEQEVDDVKSANMVRDVFMCVSVCAHVDDIADRVQANIESHNEASPNCADVDGQMAIPSGEGLPRFVNG